MLDAIATNEIIVGAYANSDGVCPMLGAHRAGGRTNLIAFAKAWDRFAFRDSRSARARRATERELRVLTTYLEASLLAEDAPDSDLGAARREHLELVARRGHERVGESRARGPSDALVPATATAARSSKDVQAGRGRGSCAATTSTSACSRGSSPSTPSRARKPLIRR